MSLLAWASPLEPGAGVLWALHVGGWATFGVSLFVLLSQVHAAPPALPGRVQARRTRAIAASRLVKLADHALRFVVSAVWQIPGLRSRSEPFLKWQRRVLGLSGYPLSLSAEEFPVAAVLFGLLTGTLVLGFGLGVNGALAMGGLATVGAYVRIMSIGALRRRLAGRDMPRHMDLIALCMSSGMDLVAALAQVSAGDRGVLTEEIGYLLRTLELGQTRRAALTELAQSLPATEVEDFCRAVIQAEIKGASVRDALVQQAAMSRVRRSVRAEEMAARAGVLLLGPMMMLVVCLVLLILGPMFVGQKWL